MWNRNSLLAVILCLLAGIVQAKPVGLQFKNAPVPEVVETVVKGILGRDYVIAPEVVTSEKKVTVVVRQIETDQILNLLAGVLSTVGVQMQERDGVMYVERFIERGGNMYTPGGGPGQSQPPAPPAAAVAAAPESKPVSLVPENVVAYRPKGRSIEFLASVVKMAGVAVAENKEKGDHLVYSGSFEAVQKAAELLAKVDRSPVSVNVRAALIEFTESSTNAHSLSIALTALAGKLGAVYEAGTKLVNAITLKGSILNAALSAIAGDSRFQYIAEPSIKVLDGESARLVVGSEVPTRGAITTDKNGNAQQSIDYKTAGIVLNLQPRVLDGAVSLKIGQQISSFALTTTSNIDSPTILKRDAQTTVSVRPGELIVLAGLDEKRNSSSTSGLPFLPPFLRSSNEENTRSQLVLMLEVTPEDTPFPADQPPVR